MDGRFFALSGKRKVAGTEFLRRISPGKRSAENADHFSVFKQIGVVIDSILTACAVLDHKA